MLYDKTNDGTANVDERNVWLAYERKIFKYYRQILISKFLFLMLSPHCHHSFYSHARSISLMRGKIKINFLPHSSSHGNCSSPSIEHVCAVEN